MFWIARHPDKSRRGEKEGTKIISDGKHGDQTLEGGSRIRVMDGEEAKRTKGERRKAKCSGEQGTRTNLGGGKRKGPDHL